MTQKKKTKDKRPLTEVELEMMNIIWGFAECSVKDVQTALASLKRDLAYTSVATIMKILEEKEFLKSNKSDRAHTYKPLISREEYESTILRHLTLNLFQGDPSSMVMRLLSESKLTADELQAIQKLVDERLQS